MTDPTSEPRKIPLRIRLPFTTEDEFVEKYGHFITKGGIFIATKAIKPEGTVLSFDLVLHDGTRVMRGEGVVQQVSTGEQSQAGMLVRFHRVDSRTKALLDKLDAIRANMETADVRFRTTPPPIASRTTPPPVAQRDSPVPARIDDSTLRIPPPRPSRPEDLTLRIGPPRSVGAAPATSTASGKLPKLTSDVVLGIDLGTTTCRAAIVVDGKAELVPIASERGHALPSVVAYDSGRGKLLVGSAAKKHRIEKPEAGLTGLKRLLGQRSSSKRVTDLKGRFSCELVADREGDIGAQLYGSVHTMPELAAELLNELKNGAQELLGRQLTRCVMCVPAWYSDHQRAAMLEAGRLAKLDVIRLLNEPTAIALAFGYGRGLARKRVLIYDLGGGTFDASVVEITGDDIDVVSTGGDNFLGGVDFDERLTESLVARLPEGPRAQLQQSRMSLERIRDAAEIAKITLSQNDTAAVDVPFAALDSSGNPVDLRGEVTRAQLELLTAPLVERTAEVTQIVLELARLKPQALDDVIIAGGQSRAPAVRRRIEALLGRSPRSDVDAQGAVAMGAALMGHAIVMREQGRAGVRLSEVLSAPIGIAVRGGGMRRLFDQNTRLPAEKTITLPFDNAQQVTVAVFQGASERADENEYVGALHTITEQAGDMSLHFAVSTDGRLSLRAIAPGGKNTLLHFSTADASDQIASKMFLEAPLPEPSAAPAKGFLSGLRRLFAKTSDASS